MGRPGPNYIPYSRRWKRHEGGVHVRGDGRFRIRHVGSLWIVDRVAEHAFYWVEGVSEAPTYREAKQITYDLEREA